VSIYQLFTYEPNFCGEILSNPLETTYLIVFPSIIPCFLFGKLTAQTADVSIQHSVHPQRFCTNKMHFANGDCWTSTCESKFTEHAATRLRERVSPSMLRHIHDAADCLLLNELNNDAYIDVEQIVKNTFPSVSTATIDQFIYCHIGSTCSY